MMYNTDSYNTTGSQGLSPGNEERGWSQLFRDFDLKDIA